MTAILTPVSRLVQGHPMVESTKGYKGQPKKDKHGNPRVEFFVGVALPKADPQTAAVLQLMQQEAQGGFPGGQWQSEDFAWKLQDGDAQQNAGKEGWAGCYILRCSTGFAPEVYTKDGAARIVEKDQIKTGDYVRVYLDIKPNGDVVNPGIYLNFSMVELVGYGEKISSGPDAKSVFGQASAPLPQGASAVPVAGAPIAQPASAPPGVGALPGATATPGHVTTPPGHMSPVAHPGASQGAPQTGPAPAGIAPAPSFLKGPQ